MKLLFTQSLQLFSEKSGRLFFAGEKVGGTEVVSANDVEKKDAESVVKLGIKLEAKKLGKEVEEEQKLKKAVFQKEANVMSDKIINRVKSEMPESEAMKLTTAQYGTKLENIGKRFQAEVGDFTTKYAKVIPNGVMDNLKIGAVFGTVAYASKDGSMMERVGSAAKWTAGAAVLAHPTITGGLAKTLSFAGKEFVGKGFVGVTNLIMEAIDNPMGLVDAMKNSNLNGKSISDTPIYQLLLHGKTANENFGKEVSVGMQNVFELRAKGLQIGDKNLHHVMDAIDLAEQDKLNGVPAAFDKTAIPSAATFIMQAAAHKMNEQEMASFRLKIWNREATPGQIRRVLANNAERDILTFFEENGMMDELQTEMTKQKVSISQSGIAPAQLDLAKTFIDGTAGKGVEGFNMKEKKHGVRRFMAMGGGGMALAMYVISFLTITGVMKLKGFAQPDNYTKALNAPKKAVSWVGAKWEGFKKKFRKSPVKTLAKLGKDEKYTDKAQMKVLGKLSKDERKSVGKKMDEWGKNKDAKLNDMKEEMKKLSGDAKKEKKKEIAKGVNMTREQYWSMFDNVSIASKKALGIEVK